MVNTTEKTANMLLGVMLVGIILMFASQLIGVS